MKRIKINTPYGIMEGKALEMKDRTVWYGLGVIAITVTAVILVILFVVGIMALIM